MHVVAHRIRLDRIVLFTTACACALSPRHTVAQSTEAPRVVQGGSVVSTVQIQRENVFDKSENSSWLARTMNKLHIVTREYVVKRELLVQEAQPYDSATAAETERNLRKLGIFRDVKIDSATTANGLTAHVTTQDSWTTQLYTSFKSGGNEITWGIGLTEKNFLGSQIKASVRYISDPDRSTTQFGVAIPRVWRNRLNLSAQYNELSDGSNARFTVAAPFTSQSTPRSLTLDAYYNDGSYFTAQNTQTAHENSYTIVNARISYFNEPTNLRFTVFGRNINDAEYHYMISEFDFTTAKLLAPPSVFGAKLQWSFE